MKSVAKHAVTCCRLMASQDRRTGFLSLGSNLTSILNWYPLSVSCLDGYMKHREALKQRSCFKDKDRRIVLWVDESTFRVATTNIDEGVSFSGLPLLQFGGVCGGGGSDSFPKRLRGADVISEPRQERDILFITMCLSLVTDDRTQKIREKESRFLAV
ncbi:unnamed protein product [Larinioides sclopetarius]|uniref:Transposase n=1 Tax=Larinioides sclopetarius TaxID=280406 RepID=A0AAV2A5H2_9ARAC